MQMYLLSLIMTLEVDEMVVGSSTESEGETEPVDCENK